MWLKACTDGNHCGKLAMRPHPGWGGPEEDDEEDNDEDEEELSSSSERFG